MIYPQSDKLTEQPDSTQHLNHIIRVASTDTAIRDKGQGHRCDKSMSQSSLRVGELGLALLHEGGHALLLVVLFVVVGGSGRGDPV